MERSPGVSVQHLRAHWASREPGVDDRAARQVWLSMLLGGCDLLPPGMPPSAVLVIRRLADPLPGRITRSPHAMRAEPEWEMAMRSTLADLWRGAVRPDQGRVPETAETVLFADRAEQTACLALSLAAGVGSDRWWRGAGTGRAGAGAGGLHRLLGEQPELLPAVLSYLAAWGRVRQVTAALTPAESLGLALMMAAAFGVPDWRLPDLAGDLGRPGGDAPSPQPLWTRIVAEQAADLGREQAVLVGLGLTLERRPRVARSAGFVRGLSAWWASATGPAGATGSPAGRGSAGLPDPAPGRVPGPGPEAGAPRPEAGGMGAPGPGRLRSPYLADPTVPPGAPGMAAAMPGGPVTGGGAPGHRPSAVPGETDQSALPLAPETESGREGGTADAGEEPWPGPSATALEGLPTRLGGLFYLINLIPRLGLPEADSDLLGPWACLEAVGRALLPAGEPWDDLAGDPVWAALAELDGREPGTLPGEGADLEAWLTPTVAEIREWLVQALPVDDPVLHLLLVPARLHITATHVDLTIDIERISLAVRMAGLDRDPGWQPAYRRVIQFHFN